LAQASRKKSDIPPLTTQLHRGVREGAVFIFGALALYLLVSLLTYQPTDSSWSHSNSGSITNSGGVTGAWFADIFLYLFGLLAYLFPFMVAYIGIIIYKENARERLLDPWLLSMRGGGFLLTLGAGCGLAALHFTNPGVSLPLDNGGGGILGQLIGDGLVSGFSHLGATLFLLALFLTGITLFTGLSWFWLMDVTGYYTLQLLNLMQQWALQAREYLEGRRARNERQQQRVLREEPAELREALPKRVTRRPPPRIEPSLNKPEPGLRVEREKQHNLFETKDTSLPPLSLLDDPEVHGNRLSDETLEVMSRQVEMKLKDFGVDVEVVAVHPGPVITRFELQPAPGVKVNQIANLAKDLARALSTISVRVVDVIPGKSVIGLEVPNEHREIVRLSEILKSQQYENADSPLALGLGKDIAGYPVVVDLARMPHLLVAGTTGSGKSVAINAMVLSLLYNASPGDVRLIMIDPKMLELSIYDGIPHLLTPVVTDMKDASNALRWCVAEMERRYKLMASLGVRQLSSYNRKVKEAESRGEPIPDPLFSSEDPDVAIPTLTALPKIVVIVDELADMMMIVGKKVEELIARLAQKARAAGIHLILATQRPSVDVITGLIKANIPTRIAFQVSSKVDSRTILDQMGAEQLLGHGDMLYLAPGTGLPVRVHGAFVSDEEVHKVVDNLKTGAEPDYIEDVIAEPLQGNGGAIPGLEPMASSDEDTDPLYDQAVRIVTESRRASISGVQRRLKIGYNRAARMIEAMEEAGIVGPLQSNGAREVLAAPPPPDH
jgi:S-DNA-T family DNA segregation ATPase FtsK/SpoIIIE